MANYTPLQKSLDDLPEEADQVFTYKLSDASVPSSATEVLIYIWATTKGEDGDDFHRYYYSIETTDGTSVYAQCMNVAASGDVSLNSANLWLPVFDGTVTVKLIDAENWPKQGQKKRKSIAYRKQGKVVEKFSEFFVMGYR